MRTAPAKRIKVDDFPALEAARYLDTETAIAGYLPTYWRRTMPVC
jgi:hypothetical protein